VAWGEGDERGGGFGSGAGDHAVKIDKAEVSVEGVGNSVAVVGGGDDKEADRRSGWDETPKPLALCSWACFSFERHRHT